MARNRDEHETFQTEIMTSVQRYKDERKEGQEPPATDFLVRLEGKDVVDFSSQYGSESSISYVASNLAGKTFVFPSYGDYTQTCVFRTYGDWWKIAPSGRKKYRRTSLDFHVEDFIEISFATSLYPVGVEIYETYNPGAICRILACDRSHGSDVDKGIRWVTLWSSKPKECKQRPRIFAPRLKKVNFATNLLRLEVCHKYMEYYTELDGIRLVGTSTPPASDLMRHHQGLATEEEGWFEERTSESANAVSELTYGLESVTLEESDQLEAPSLEEEEDLSYMTQLPKELVQFILNYLDITDLCRVAQTCSMLRDHAYDPLLYLDLNLQPYWNRVNNSSLAALSERCERLQRLNLSWIGKGGTLYADTLASFLGDCHSLTTLELSACQVVDSNMLQLIMANCKGLHELNLASCTSVDDFSCFSLLALPELRGLSLYRTKVDTSSLLALIRTSPHLEKLNISSCVQLNPYINMVLMDLGENCKKLRCLDLWRMKNVNSDGLAHLYNNCPLLEELDVGWCSELKSISGCFINLTQKCTKLKKLFMTANRFIQNSDLISLATHCPLMEQIDILGTRDVTREAIHYVLDKCPHLVFLDLSFCVNISIDDVWGWRTNFPHVAVKKSFQHISIVD